MKRQEATMTGLPGTSSGAGDPLAAAREFLASRRIALVGFSRNPKDYSRFLDAELRKRGIDVVPVHPAASQVDGRRCFLRVGDIDPPVDGALVMVPASQAEGVARDCLDAGLRRIWFHRGAGPGSASPEALALCVARGVNPISNLCPLMVIQGAGWPHRLHGWLRRRKR
jgi:predicted CoA-binding protein